MVRVATSGIRQLLFWVLAALLLGAMAAFAQVRVNSITIEGNQRIPDATILTILDLERGAVATDGKINDALQRLVATGLFESVEITPTGAGLIIAVVERPTINRISVEGNRRLDDSEILDEITSAPRRVYSPTIASEDASRIVDAYTRRARLAARVTPKIIRRGENRVDLIFEVSEGRVVENERVSFVGNRAFSDRRLRRVVDTKQAGFLRTIVERDTFIPERIAFDRQLLTDFYSSRGYVDFRVLDVSTELSRERDATFVTFTLREGQRFEVGEIEVTSEFENLNIDEYRRAIKLRSGETWNPSRIEEQIERLEQLALQQGFDFLRADPRITRNDRDLTLDVEFALVRGPRIFVERIDIEGNQTTLDRVIRRQFDTVEGDPFNPREIRNAAERIRALGFFAQADVEAREGTTQDQVIVDVDVEEQPTGSLSFGGSYNNDTGFAIAVGFSERNFLGRGQALTFDVQTGTENSTSLLAFREPALLGRDLTLGLEARHATADYDDATYQLRSSSFSPSLAFPLTENSRLSVYYEVAQEDIYNVSGTASAIIAAEAGELWKSSVGYQYTLDLLRGGLNPNRGLLLSFGQEFAGLGGDVDAIKTTARAVAQRDIMNEEVTLRAILEGGLISSSSGTSRVSDRFFLSSTQLRGFASRGVGPRDTTAGDSDVLGGNKYVSLRFEADFPIGLPEEYGIEGGVFADFGSVWALDNNLGGLVDDSFELRSSVGVSVFWTTLIGPLRLNFSKPIKKNVLDETNSFDITISTEF